jgi:hypothetical protein
LGAPKQETFPMGRKLKRAVHAKIRDLSKEKGK